ncbi:MAG: NAD kinase [Flavobacteriaceae bacterium]
MKIAVYSLLNSEACQQTVQNFISHVQELDFEVSYEQRIADWAGNSDGKVFSSYEDLDKDTDLFFSIGGDGTLLRSLEYIQDSGIPVIGINTGRLGFLATVNKEDLGKALGALTEGAYTIEPRTLLQVSVEGDTTPDLPLALNEVTVGRKNTTAMITIHTQINGEKLNSYWADGFIVATPTGSTGYSLSNGGPLIDPESQSFVLTPIAPHNLNARPMVISNDVVVTLSVESREADHLLSLDSRIHSIPTGKHIRISKALFTLNLARLKSDSFYKTLRTKLHWGKDRRN